MKFNDLKLDYPDNLYADVDVFQDENESRCYYFHSKSSGMPSDAFEAVNFLLSNYFAKNTPLCSVVREIYINGKSSAETAELNAITEEELREILYKFFRDLLYFPRYSNIFRNGLR